MSYRWGIILFFCLSIQLSFGEETKKEISVSSPIVVIQEPGVQKKEVCKAFVESGKKPLSGRPEINFQAAYRSWEQVCAEWKTEMKVLNKQNLMIADCGEAVLLKEKITYQFFYTYKSQGSYKIKVDGR